MKVILCLPSIGTIRSTQAVEVCTAETPQEAIDIVFRSQRWLAGYVVVAVIDNEGILYLRGHNLAEQNVA